MVKNKLLLSSNESKNKQYSLISKVISAGVSICEFKKDTAEDKA